MTDQSVDNLLFALHRWAWRQDENFLSEAFAHLLRRLLAYEPAAGADMLSFLTDGRLSVPRDKAERVEVTTQVTTAQGRPDVELRTTEHLAYVEVKIDAGLGWRQLERYWAALAESDRSNKTLVLLTRHPMGEHEALPEGVVCRRWHEVADKLMGLQSSLAHGEGEALFLVEQFVSFLRLRGVTMDRVGWELPAGIKAYTNLMDMIREALARENENATLAPAKDYAGFNVLDGKAWVGVVFDEPASVLLHSNGVAVDPAVAEAIGRGEVDDDPWYKGKLRWLDELKLDSEEVHFFARLKTGQMQVIESFVSAGLEAVRDLIENEIGSD